ncbi:BRO family protein [Nonomuraea sp. NPDC001023]|uniref:BRO family protein n=1 Tax=unclassified Nonomuraea TaxID=2593643 RepID=UPI0033345CBF
MTELNLFGGPSANFEGNYGVVHYPQTGQSLRWVKINGVPWLHFADICKGTGHANPRSAIHLVEEGDKRKIDMRTLSAGQTAVNFPTPGTGNAEAWFVNEDGFATIGLAGRGDGPRVFRRWVVKVVIPGFRAQQRELSRKDLALMVVAAEEERERAIAERDHVRRELVAVAPKVAVFDAWFDPENAVEPTDFAKRIGLRSAQQLNGHLRDLGILRRDKHPRTGKARNLPTADWGHCFKVVPTRIPTGGFVDVAWILPQGQLEIVEELRNHGLIDF